MTQSEFMNDVREVPWRNYGTGESGIRYAHKDYSHITRETPQELHDLCMLIPTFNEVMSKAFFYIDRFDPRWGSCHVWRVRIGDIENEVSVKSSFVEDGRYNIVDRAFEKLYESFVKQLTKEQSN